MSRAYRISVNESAARQLKAGDEIGTCLEILEILSPEEMAQLLKNELEGRGFTEAGEGIMTRQEGPITVTIDPCSGEVTVSSEATERVEVEAKRDATGFNDVGPGESALRDRVREQLKADLEKKFDHEQSRIQTEATKQLERKLTDLQPEISDIVNKVTRDALKIKAGQMGTITEISEDEASGELLIKLEV